MICDKNREINELKQENLTLRQVLRQLVAHDKLFLKTHVSIRYRLKILIAEAEKALGGDYVGSGSDSTRK